MPVRFSKNTVRAVGVYTAAQGVVILADRAVTANPAWTEARKIPTPIWGVLLLVAGLCILAGDTYWPARIAGAAAAMAATTFLAVIFTVNAFRLHGAGLSGALSWLLPTTLLFETVVFLGRRR